MTFGPTVWQLFRAFDHVRRLVRYCIPIDSWLVIAVLAKLCETVDCSGGLPPVLRLCSIQQKYRQKHVE